MEFERALFRVYERSIEGLLVEEDAVHQTDPIYKKSCKLFEGIIFSVGCFFLFCLIYLHTNIVGSTGCLPQALTYYNTSTNRTERLSIQGDTIIGINIDSSLFLSDDDSIHHVDDTRRRSRRLRGFLPLINMFSNDSNSNTNPNDGSSQTTTTTSDNNDENSNTNYHYKYDYLVTFDRGVTYLSNKMRSSHHFPVYNVTLPITKECFGNNFMQHLLPIGGVDIVIMNHVIYTTQQSGYMVTKTGEVYHWREEDIYPYHQFSEWLRYKLSILLLSALAFFFLSTITALLVRTLISSGIVIIFPIIWSFQICGINALNLRLVAISYPWIGLPLQLIRSRQQPLEPFIIGHFTRALLYYILYIAAQNLFIQWFYAYDSVVEQEQLLLYAILMLWEYYAMIYMRSAYSIWVFPRVTMFMFMVYHIYYYSFPSGFHLVALSVVALFSIALMAHCARVYETKAFRLGYITLEQPRMLYNSLPWPSWRGDLAPDYTLFMPVTNTSRGVYQNTIPRRPGDVGDAPNGGGESDPAVPPPLPGRPGTVPPVQEGNSGNSGGNGGYVELRTLGSNNGGGVTPSDGPFYNWSNSSPLTVFSRWFSVRHNYESIQGADQSAHSNVNVSGNVSGSGGAGDGSGGGDGPASNAPMPNQEAAPAVVNQSQSSNPLH